MKIKTQVYTCIKKLQKAIAEKKIRKTSEYASQIVYIRNRLIAFYNDMKSGTKTYEIPAAKLAELKEACNMRRADHVVIIRQYINILNDIKTGLTGKAQKLLKKIEASEFSGNDKVTIANITKNCLFFFCDSANSMQMDLPRFEQVTKLYPYLSWVLMFRTTKDGNFLGEKNWKHAVNVEV